jgi:hypothetical protein
MPHPISVVVRRDFRLNAFGFVCFVFLIAAIGTSCSESHRAQPVSETKAPESVVVKSSLPSAAADAVKPAEVLPPDAPTGFSRWRLTFPGNTAQHSVPAAATVESNDTIPTRTGPRKPLFTLLCRDGKLEMIVNAWSMAQTVSTPGESRNVPFRLQYDSLAPRVVPTMQSTDHESFLFPNPKQELARIEKANTLRMSFTQFQAGSVEFSFDIGHFDDARNALTDVCPVRP